MSETELTRLRGQIDQIDDKLIDLIKERCGFVKQVGELKKSLQTPQTSFIRAGREADMVRRIAQCFASDGIAPAAAAQIWRIIISASLALESPLSISAFAAKETPELYWLAREYFGSSTAVATEPTAKRVLGDVLDGKASVGILPLPDDSPAGLWWPRLPVGLMIFACLPFVLQKNEQIKALALAKVTPEPTGKDVSLLSIETDMDVSQNRLKTLCDKLKLDVRWLAVETFPSGHRAHLIEVQGFVMQDHVSISAFNKELGASALAIRSLGAYATPITL